MIKKTILRIASISAALLLCRPFCTYAVLQDNAPLTSNVQSAQEKTELKYKTIPVTQFRVDDISPKTDTALDYTEWWYSEWDDCRYLFLPSTADRKKLKITYKSSAEVSLNGKALKSGEVTSLLSEDDTFKITVNGKDCGTLKVMQSNLGCIYLSTKSGGTDALDANRNIVETGTVLMLNADGVVEYNGDFEKLTDHGNTTWDYSKKKPYNLKLPEKANLYGMGKAKKWVLLANYLDHSMLRNYLTQKMAKAAGVEYTLDSVYVDLYADGSYRGTYQLYEKVQIQKHRVNITDLEEATEEINNKDLKEYAQKVVGAKSADEYMENSYKYYDIPKDPDDITGGYLLQFQQWNRYGKKCESGFVTRRGQAIAIDGPEYASKNQVEYIRSFVQDMEDAIYSEDGYNSKGKHYSDYMDVDSFIRAYLIQEISQNVDSTNSSFYMWKDSDLTGDGKLHFSPPWDFDLSYCNMNVKAENSDGESAFSTVYNTLYAAYFAVNGYNKSGRPAAGINWAGTLYKKEDYHKRVAEIYYESFKPFLNKLTGGDEPYLTQLAESIRPSAEMSNMRWHTYGGRPYTVFGSSSGPTYMDSVEILRKYIEKRFGWLNELWYPYSGKKGDANADGSINLADAVWIMQCIAEPDKYQLSEMGEINADVDGVKGITNKDALIVQQYKLRILSKL